MIFLVVGSLLFIAGALFKLFPTKKPGAAFGYRSYVAKKSALHWQYAQKLAANYFLVVGAVTLAIGLVLRQTGNTNFYLIEMLLITAPVILPFALTEEKLKEFDIKHRGEDNEHLND